MKWWRRLWWIAATSLGMLAALAGGAWWVLGTPWFREKVRQRIVREVEDATGGRVEAGSFGFDRARMRAEVRSFVLHGTEPSGEPPLFRASSVAVTFRIVSILRRKVDLIAAEIDRPEVAVTIDENGRTNFPTPRVARRARRPLEVFVDLAVDRYRLTGGTLRFRAETLPLEVRGEDLRVRMAYERRAAPRYLATVSSKRLAISRPFPSRPAGRPHSASGGSATRRSSEETVTAAFPQEWDGEVDAAIERQRIELRRFRLTRGRSSVEGSGEVRMPPEWSMAIRYQARLMVAEVGPALGMPAPHDGRLDSNGRFLHAHQGAWSLTGELAGNGLSWRQGGVLIHDIGLSSGYQAAPGELRLDPLNVSMLDGRFQGWASVKSWRHFTVEGHVQDFSLAKLETLKRGTTLPISGVVSGPIGIEGDLAGPAPAGVSVQAKLEIAPSPGKIPVEGSLDLSYDQRGQAIHLGLSHLATPSSRINFSGSAVSGIHVGMVSRDLNELLPLMALASESAPERLPLQLRGSQARFDGELTGGPDQPRIAGVASIGPFEHAGRQFDRLEADIVLERDRLAIRHLSLESVGVRLEGRLEIALDQWRPGETSAATGSFRARGLTSERIMSELGIEAPVRASGSATVELAGTVATPVVSGRLQLDPIEAWGEIFDGAVVEARYQAPRLEVVSGRVRAGAGELEFAGGYEPSATGWREGDIGFRWTAKGFLLSQWKAVRNMSERLSGQLNGKGAGRARIRGGAVHLLSLDGDASASRLTLDQTPLGELSMTARTTGGLLTVRMASSLGGSSVRGRVEWPLGDRPVGLGEIQVSNMTFRALQNIGLLGGPAGELPLEGSFDGEIGFRGALSRPDLWDAAAKITRVEISPSGTEASPDLKLRNREPLLAYLNQRGVQIPGVRIVSRDMDLEAAGTVSYRTRSPWNLQLRGSVNLAVLSAWKPDLMSAGISTLDATVRGSWNEPQVVGRMDLRDASLNLRGMPNGFEKVTGTIRFDRTRATIEKLTAQTGGGDLDLSGFVGFGGPELVYRLQAAARRVRVRFPEDVSSSWNGDVQWTGTATRSLLSGVLTVQRIGLDPELDFGSLLAESGRPVSTPAAANEFLRGMQFDLRIESASDAALETSLTKDIQPRADLRLRGGPSKPVLMGRILVDEGEIRFFGNQYTITRGEIGFLNPVKIEPVLSLDVETRVRGVTVTILFTGPLNRMNVTYHSDPPLQSSEIVALLTVGRAPGSSIAPAASTQPQGVFQAGGNTLLGTALSAPLSGRLERFFGVSRIKIDPELTGVANTPQARLTIEQQPTRDITVTYITNLNRTQQSIVRLQWDFSRRFSMLAAREENGVFGIDFQYRRRFK